MGFLHMGVGDRMIELIEKQQFHLTYNWRVDAYPRGTVRLSEPVNERAPDGSWVNRGRMIIPSTPPAETREGKNLIVDTGHFLVGDMLMDETGYDTGLTYHAMGTGTTAVAAADLTLTTETSRKIMTAKSRLLGVVTYSTFFTAAESTYAIKEAGVFGHSDASGTADSGSLFSHYLVTFDNSGGNYDITFSYVLSIA